MANINRAGVFDTTYAQDLAIDRTPRDKLWKNLAFLALLLAPLFSVSGPLGIGLIGDQYIGLIARVAIFVIAVQGLNLLVGYTGQISLGHCGVHGDRRVLQRDPGAGARLHILDGVARQRADDWGDRLALRLAVAARQRLLSGDGYSRGAVHHPLGAALSAGRLDRRHASAECAGADHRSPGAVCRRQHRRLDAAGIHGRRSLCGGCDHAGNRAKRQRQRNI